ncbi:MAG: hypothetical protein M1819_001771 [Sarea resinae]|nr:MAG: hypothetical protein M1819_001771 [Sarea resinae]
MILYPRFFSPLLGLPQPAGNTFLLGHFPILYSQPSGEPAREWINTIPNDGLIRYLGLFDRERLLLTSTKALAEVLNQKAYDFVKPSQIRNGLGRLTGNGVLMAEGEDHKFQRKHLMPAFSFRHIKNLYPTFWSKARELVEVLEKRSSTYSKETGEQVLNEIDFMPWSSRVTLDIIGVAGMGQDFEAIQDQNSDLCQAYRRAFSFSGGARMLAILNQFLPPWLLRNLPIKRNAELKEANKIIRKTCLQLIKQKQEKLARNEAADVDILSVSIESGGFSDETLIDQARTFLAAGHETTAAALNWATFVLCKYPEVQTRLRQEIRSNLPSFSAADSQITSLDIDKLVYLQAVCNEILRFIPPVPNTLRESLVDTSIQGHFVPKGTRIIICPWAINHSESLWDEDPGVFDPERWLGPGRANSGGGENNYAFMTFFQGPRSCIGQSFSKAEFACLVAALFGRFEMEMVDKELKPKLLGGITVKPGVNLMVKMKVVEGW